LAMEMEIPKVVQESHLTKKLNKNVFNFFV
jgi:hypothetical protein